MLESPETVRRREVGEWVLHGDKAYENPFADVIVEAVFEAPSGQIFTVLGFYDGENTWRVRFNPAEAGTYSFRVTSRLEDPGLMGEGTFQVEDGEARGYLQATPERGWGFSYESGERVFLLGDTTYNLFGMAHCEEDVEGFLARRAEQAFNLFRVRVPVSPFHPPEGYSVWQDRRTWPWGGSEQKPLFDRFNLEYFHSVDDVVRKAEALGLGFEMIMEAWGFEAPFNRRDVFTPEWEQFWMRYLVARYDAFNCVYFWTLMNEYEYYPDGDWRYNPVADRWAMRMGRWMKRVAPHGHIISVHNGPREPAFVERFAQDLGAIDAVMFQDWGTRDEERGWLAAGIDEQIAESLRDWPGSAVFAEWGYERNPHLPLAFANHAYCDEEHTRRGAWRGTFCGLGIIHGFENSWGPFADLENDQPGLEYLLHLHRFFTEIVSFERLAPAPELIAPGEYALGEKPLALASSEEDVVAVYLPVGGEVFLRLSRSLEDYVMRKWFDPCSGELVEAAQENGADSLIAPRGAQNGHPQDWVLLLQEEG